MAGRHRMFDADSAPQWDNTAQAQIAALRGEPLGRETLESFRQKAARDGGWSLGLKSSRLVYRYCFGARVWKSIGRLPGCDLKDAEAAGRWMKTGEYAELHDRAVKAQGRSEALTNARKRRKKTKVLLDKPHARDGKDRTGAERQALGSEFELGSQASGGTSSVNTAPAGLSHRGRTQQRSAAAAPGEATWRVCTRSQSKPQLTLTALAEHDGAGGGASLSRTDSATETHTGDSPRAPSTRSTTFRADDAIALSQWARIAEAEAIDHNADPWDPDGADVDRVRSIGVYRTAGLAFLRDKLDLPMEGFVANDK